MKKKMYLMSAAALCCAVMFTSCDENKDNDAPKEFVLTDVMDMHGINDKVKSITSYSAEHANYANGVVTAKNFGAKNVYAYNPDGFLTKWETFVRIYKEGKLVVDADPNYNTVVMSSPDYILSGEVLVEYTADNKMISMSDVEKDIKLFMKGADGEQPAVFFEGDNVVDYGYMAGENGFNLGAYQSFSYAAETIDEEKTTIDLATKKATRISRGFSKMTNEWTVNSTEILDLDRYGRPNDYSGSFFEPVPKAISNGVTNTTDKLVKKFVEKCDAKGNWIERYTVEIDYDTDPQGVDPTSVSEYRRRDIVYY